MTKIRRTSRVSKQQWLAKALEVSIQKGEPGINIELLAREIGVAKAGFYWHFKDRAELLDQLLDYWSDEYTGVIINNVTVLELPAAERLLTIMEMIEEHDLAGLDLHFHVWARKDAKVARKVQKVIRGRLDYLRKTFAELGFSGDEVEMRARLFLAYEANESLMFRFKTRGQVKRLQQRRWRQYLRLPQDKSPSS
jgi:AcrR family transcriptional regulator